MPDDLTQLIAILTQLNQTLSTLNNLLAEILKAVTPRPTEVLGSFYGPVTPKEK